MATLSPSSVEEQVMALLVSRLGIDGTQIGPDITFDELELDSLTLVEFSLILQEHFCVAMRDDELSPESSIGQAAELLANKMNEKAATE